MKVSNFQGRRGPRYRETIENLAMIYADPWRLPAYISMLFRLDGRYGHDPGRRNDNLY